jgi:hypothetical protein
MADQSFFVHLQSLFNFASELQTQLTGMATPIDHLDTLSTTPVLLGDFGEASALGAIHRAAVTEMAELLGQVQQAVTFAENITKTVATGYQQLDQNIAGGMQVDPGYSATGGSSGSSSGQDSVWVTAFGAPDNNGGGNGSGGWGGNGGQAGGEGGWT